MGRLYDKREWRRLPREECVLDWLGECAGPIHLHHVHGHESEETVPVCSRHHPMAEKLRRPERRSWRRCTHNHRYPGAREECERRLNTAA
jgi:hypothetical protein